MSALLRRWEPALVAVLMLLAQSQVWWGWADGGAGAAGPGHRPERALLLLLTVAPLAWRRSRPLLVTGLVVLGITVQVLLVVPAVSFLGGFLPLVVAVYASAAHARRWPALGLLLGLGAEAVLTAGIAEERRQSEILFGVFVLAGTWLAGDVVRHRVRRADGLVAAERARIARELHDVVAHSVSVMSVQAGAARALLDVDDHAGAREAVLAVEETARSSVAELQRLLAVLREHDADAPLRPQPGLALLPELVDQVRGAGLPVTVEAGPLPVLSPGLDLTAYRIVQESLTNALRHSGGATRVAVRADDRVLRVEVSNDGPVGAPAASGHGLVGMRERAHLFAGTLEAGPDDGGFVVRAVLPLS